MVLVFAEQQKGEFKKSIFEAVNYGAKIASDLGQECHAVVLGPCQDAAQLGKYGATQVHHYTNQELSELNSKLYSKAITDAVEKSQAQVVVFSNSIGAKALAPRISAKLKAGLVSGAVDYPNTTDGFTVKKSVFSGKAFANVKINSEKKVIALTPNSFAVSEGEGQATINEQSIELGNNDMQVLSENLVTGTVPLSEAELVVSGGRGLKGPENWGIIEELASSIGATLACSRPVADSHWRPHHEHVGQTGGTIRPNLYIAIGISGAIQHLAGVNTSKTIVVINKDPEAPFFKAADYGIVGDAFEVVPRLTEAFKKYKEQSN